MTLPLFAAAFATLGAATGFVPLTAEVKAQARTAQVRDCYGFDEAAIYAATSPARTAYLLARCLGDDVEGYEYPVLVDKGLATHVCMRQATRWKVGTQISAGCAAKVVAIHEDGRRML